MSNQLATVQTVEEILPHDNADALEIAKVLGWYVIVKKDEFKVGDLCIYVQVDSILPEKPEFEFMRDRKFRVKTIKLRGVYSQGICFPVSLVPEKYHAVGVEVTDVIGIKKYEKEAPDSDNANQPNKGFFAKWYSYLKWRFWAFLGYYKPNGDFPTNIISKTDEDRIQSCPGKLSAFYGKECYGTIKHDGTSVTFIRQKALRVCSRNRELSLNDSVYWNMAKKYKLNAIPVGYNVQAEIVGPGIQGNPEGLEDHEIRVFNVYKDREALTYTDMVTFCHLFDLPMADLYYHGVFKWTTVQEIMEEVSKARYKNGTQAEGIVFRLCEPKLGKLPSFKAVSPEYCFKHGE